MVEILLKIRVMIYRMFTPILRISLTPFNNDASLVVKALLDQLKTRGNPYLVIISLGLKIGKP